MRRILPAILLALWMLGSVALAEVCQGTTTAAFSVQVEANEAGVLAALNVAAGDRVSEGDVLGSFFTEKAFAAQDGTIVSISAAEGDDVDGDILELAPVERYRIYGAVAGAYASAGTMLVHTGASRIGIGTAVASDVETCAASGTIARMHVSMGEYVERGELLFETGGGMIAAPSAGIAAGIAAGDRVGIVYTADPQERTETGVVEEISQIAGEGGYAVRIRPDSVENLRLGMTADVRFGGE